MRSNPVVSIIGAGPSGVTIAAYLKYFGVDFRIFGSPMHRWLSQMPKQMFLKSEGCASSLPDPTGEHTLARYCREENLSFSEYGTPVSREIFARYATSFQRKIVPNVENVNVVAVNRLAEGFELRLSSGEKLNAGKVIVATGLDYMAHIPDQLARLPIELRSHSADHFDLSAFKGKEVLVVGAGQSGTETAAILREEGVSVRLLVRTTSLLWHPLPSMVHKSKFERLRNPRTRLGDGRDLWFYDNLPGLFHYLSQRVRLATVAETLGPAGAWWLKDRVVGQFPIFLGCHIRGAETQGTKVALQVADQNGQLQSLVADHVIAATGYRFNTHNLPFLSENIKGRLLLEKHTPQLSSNFESSIPGLYFAGPASANSFGPVMRFLAGVGYPARRISHHVAQSQRLQPRRVARPVTCHEF